MVLVGRFIIGRLRQQLPARCTDFWYASDVGLETNRFGVRLSRRGRRGQQVACACSHFPSSGLPGLHWSLSWFGFSRFAWFRVWWSAVSSVSSVLLVLVAWLRLVRSWLLHHVLKFVRRRHRLARVRCV